MFEYSFENVLSFDKTLLNPNRDYLWVIHADKIPPHIAVSKNGKYYSLKNSGKDDAININSVLTVIEKKKIKTLVFEIESNEPRLSLKEVFVRHKFTIPNQVTCLDPIKSYFNCEKAQTLHGMLSNLEEIGAIRNVYGLNIDINYSGIPIYNICDVHTRLEKLNEKKG